jgi:hypothetical protein
MGPVVFVVVGTWAILDTRRNRRLSLLTLALVAGTSMWWQEWFGDWGSYLIYNPKFHLIPWHTSLWTTPNKPWSVIPAYGWYYAIIFPFILFVVSRIRQARPTWNRHLTTITVALVLFYAWDLAVEGVASQMGWWSYTHTFGPALNSSKGSFPLLFPILVFCLFGVVATWIMDQRDDRGRFVFEAMVGVPRVAEGWRRETARAATWVVTLNGLYVVLLIAPVVFWRQVWGPVSHIVP